MGTHREQDCERRLILISDDNGVTWYPRHGNPLLAEPLPSHTDKVGIGESADAGTTWTIKQ